MSTPWSDVSLGAIVRHRLTHEHVLILERDFSDDTVRRVL